MENCEVKGTGSLIDELITTSVRMWHLQDEIMAGDVSAVGAKARRLQTLNAHRSELIRAIEMRLDGQTQLSAKTYEKNLPDPARVGR